MNSITICVGIDVSKDRLDVQVPGLKYFSIENSRQGEPLRGRGHFVGGVICVALVPTTGSNEVSLRETSVEYRVSSAKPKPTSASNGVTLREASVLTIVKLNIR